MTSKPTLSDQQIKDIIRLSALGRPTKVVARAVNCSIHQVFWYWSRSDLYKARGETRRMRKVRLTLWAKRQALMRVRKANEQARLNAIAWLSSEVAAAQKEAATAPLYKLGPLEW